MSLGNVPNKKVSPGDNRTRKLDPYKGKVILTKNINQFLKEWKKEVGGEK